jgi:tripartite-type tricarboxylate transporter receptor subunit TctC
MNLLFRKIGVAKACDLKKHQKKAMEETMRLRPAGWFAAVSAAASLTLTPAPQVLAAEKYPDKPIRIIVPYLAGGLVDTLARATGNKVAESLGQPVIVVDRPGASSIIGMEACARAKPDGYTLCMTVADSLSYNPQLFAKLPYDPEKDFVPVLRLAWTNNLIAANAKAPFDNYEQMVAYAKEHPGVINWATWGPATLPDLYLRWIAAHEGVKITGIPYGGAAQGNTAVYSGEVHVSYFGFGVAAPQIAAGVMKPIVTVGDKRSPFMPDLPSLGEERADPGLQGYFGLYAPGGTPAEIIGLLNKEFSKAVGAADVQKLYKASTLVWEPNTPEQFAAFAKADRSAAAKVFRSIGVTPRAAPQ